LLVDKADYELTEKEYIYSKMKGKRGWIRIVEAFIAILMISGVLVFIMSERTKTTSNEKIDIIVKVILREITDSEDLRNAVVSDDVGKLTDFIATRIPSTLNYEIKICEIDNICSMQTYIPENVYAQEAVVSSTLDEYNVKKIKIFVWQK